MHCANCVSKIKSKISSLDNISNVVVSLDDTLVTFDSAQEITLETLNNALSSLEGNYKLVEYHAPTNTTSVSSSNRFRTFIPLILIISIVLILTVATVFIKEQLGIHTILRFYMSYFFMIFGSLKLINLNGFAQAFSKYDIVAKRFVSYGLFYPFIELLLGLAFFFDAYPIITNLITLIIMFVGSLGIYNSLKTNQKIQCACVGTFFNLPMTKVTLLENGSMFFMSLYMLLFLL